MKRLHRIDAILIGLALLIAAGDTIFVIVGRLPH
jgi:hypothetical protein